MRQIERFQLTAALTPLNRQNLAALLTGVIGPDGKLSLELLELPRETRVPGPGQAQQTMTADAGVRQQITFLQGQGHRPPSCMGTCCRCRTQGGLLYVEPVYLKLAQSNPFPLMRLVLVSYGTEVGFAPTLPDAIKAMVAKNPTPGTGNSSNNNGGTTTTPPPNTSGSQMSPALLKASQDVQAAIDELRKAQQSGDFQAEGKALADLDAATKEFEQAAAAAGVPNATPPGATPTPAPTG